ncbi:MAG TPA: hypothetical protein VKI41_02385 [Vicinamibacteria bacterium]|nr:hypothetical protein [Vicinamibacteria bacterium]
MRALAARLFRIEPKIRYVAVNQDVRIVEMVQSPQHPSYNPPESDRIEELIVNPIVLEITRRRGEIDMQGVRHVLIRYGTQYQLILPYGDGHASVGVELADDPLAIARPAAMELGLPGV